MHLYITKVKAVVQSSAMKPFFEFLVSSRFFLKSDSQEAILCVRNDRNYKPDHYD